MCVKKFIFSKFAGLQNYSQQLYYQMNSFIGVFRQHFKPLMLPPCIDLSSPVKKYMDHVTHPLNSADISIFHRKSANFVISRNTDIDCILLHNF